MDDKIYTHWKNNVDSIYNYTHIIYESLLELNIGTRTPQHATRSAVQLVVYLHATLGVACVLVPTLDLFEQHCLKSLSRQQNSVSLMLMT